MVKKRSDGPGISLAQIAELLSFRLMDAMMAEVKAESDPVLALRKALLTLIVMTQQTADEATRQWIDHLLTNFKPLCEGFGDHAHPMCGGHSVVRTRSDDGKHVVLALPESLVFELMQFLGDLRSI